MVSGRRGLKAVNRFCRNGTCRIMPKRDIGRLQIVVDRLGNADNVQPHLGKLVGNGLGPVASNGDKHIQLQVAAMGQDLVRGIHDAKVLPLAHGEMEGISLVGRPKDGPPEVDDPRHVQRRQHTMPPLHQSLKAVQNSYDAGPEMGHRRLGNASDHGVQPGAVSSPGQDTYSLQLHTFPFLGSMRTPIYGFPETSERLHRRRPHAHLA
jgi:hypothetical protein